MQRTSSPTHTESLKVLHSGGCAAPLGPRSSVPVCPGPLVHRGRTVSPPSAQEGRELARGGVAGGGGAGRHSLPEQPARVIKKPPNPARCCCRGRRRPRASGWTSAKDPGAWVTPPCEGRPARVEMLGRNLGWGLGWEVGGGGVGS